MEPFEKFQKAYVDHEPDIEVHDLSERDRWLILATDGMWNHMKRADVAEYVS